MIPNIEWVLSGFNQTIPDFNKESFKLGMQYAAYLVRKSGTTLMVGKPPEVDENSEHKASLIEAEMEGRNT